MVDISREVSRQSEPLQPYATDNIPSAYFNGFQMMLSNADVSATLLLANEPTLKLNMSYTTAKTLSRALADMIGTLEKVTGHDIMTVDEVGRGLEKITSEAND